MFGKMLTNKFNQNVAILLVGTVMSQAIPIAISPILTRIYSPSDFGLFALYFSISMILSVFVTGRYEMAIMLPKDEVDAVDITKLSISITVIVSALLFVVIYIFKARIAEALKNKEIENWLLLLPVTVLVIGFYQSLNYLNSRHEQFKTLAFSRFARSINTSGFSLLMGFFKTGNNGFILGDSIGQAIATVFLFFRSSKLLNVFKNSIDINRMKMLAIRYKHFPLFNVPSGLLEKSSGQVPIILLANFFGNNFVGLFSLSQRVISAPSGIVARAFGDVFRQQATKEYVENGSCKNLFTKTFKKLFFLSILPFIVLFIYSPVIFEFVFGKEWRIAGEYAQLMTPMFFLQFFVSPLSNMFYVAEKQKLDFVIQFILFLSLCLGLYIGFHFFDSSFVAILLFTCVYCIKYIIELLLSYKFSLGNKYA